MGKTSDVLLRSVLPKTPLVPQLFRWLLDGSLQGHQGHQRGRGQLLPRTGGDRRAADRVEPKTGEHWKSPQPIRSPDLLQLLFMHEI